MGAPQSPAQPSPLQKRKWLMHTELSARLHLDVYHALDTTTGMDMQKRAKLQESCLKHDMSLVLDCTTSAAFGHQLILALSDRAHFDPLLRGLAFACAGRSATSSADEPQNLSDSVNHDAFLRSMRADWHTMIAAFAADTELSSTHSNTLWQGPIFIMRLRAARAATWGVPEVETACREQLAALPAYRSAIATAITRVASTYEGAEAARWVNKAYLTFMYPFWSEHLLERGRLSKEEVAKQVKEILTPAKPTPAPAPALPPTAPHALPPVAPPPTPWPPTLPPPMALPPPPYYPLMQPGGFYAPPPAANPQTPGHVAYADQDYESS
jgi:hypothetical protein